MSSTSCQDKQQNMVAEVSAQLSLLSLSLVFPANLPACPGAVGRAPSPCAWGVPGCAGVQVPRGELAGAVLTAAPLAPRSGRVAKEVMESSAKIKREPPEIHR